MSDEKPILPPQVALRRAVPPQAVKNGPVAAANPAATFVESIRTSMEGHQKTAVLEQTHLAPPQTAADRAEEEKAPEAATKAPEAATKAPEAATKAPEAATKAPEAATKAPEAATKAPEAATKAPEAATKAPEAATKAPEAATKAPEAAAPVQKKWKFVKRFGVADKLPIGDGKTFQFRLIRTNNGLGYQTNSYVVTQDPVLAAALKKLQENVATGVFEVPV